MNRICPHCGAELPENASFCPYCAHSLNVRVECKPPKAIWGRVLHIGIMMAIAAGIMCAAWLYTRPQELEGAGSVQYTDADGSYQIHLAKSSERFEPPKVVNVKCEPGEEYRFPLCVTFYDSRTGENVSHSMAKKIKYSQISFEQSENSAYPWRATEPVYSGARPDAALTSFMDFVLESGSSRIIWTLGMTNGDTIRLNLDTEIEEIPVVHYYPEDAPMQTAEELQALVDEVDRTIPPETIVYLHLPAVTYTGDLTIDQHPINLCGSEEGRTVFTGHIYVTTMAEKLINYFDHIDFLGSRDRIGISAADRVHLTDCTISGWKTGVLAYGDTWVNAMHCRWENNQIGFHFNADGSRVSHTQYTGNQFIGNGTAVLLENVPTDISLKFADCRFAGNDVDIDNRCQQELDISQAVFE